MINIIREDEPFGYRVQVWLDTEIRECDGICIGAGDSESDALTDAIGELETAIKEMLKRRDQVDEAAARGSVA